MSGEEPHAQQEVSNPGTYVTLSTDVRRLVLLGFTTLLVVQLPNVPEPQFLSHWMSAIAWAETRVALLACHLALVMWTVRRANVTGEMDLAGRLVGAFFHFNAMISIAVTQERWVILFIIAVFFLVMSLYLQARYDAHIEATTIVRFVVTTLLILVVEALIVGVVTLIPIWLIRRSLNVDQSFFVLFPPTCLSVIAIEALAVENQHMPSLGITQGPKKVIYFLICACANGVGSTWLAGTDWLDSMAQLGGRAGLIKFCIGVACSALFFFAAVGLRSRLQALRLVSIGKFVTVAALCGAAFGVAGLLTGGIIASFWKLSSQPVSRIGALVISHAVAGALLGLCFCVFARVTGTQRERWGL